MCSRTSGGEIIRKTIASFFDLYPTPTAVVEADIGTLRELLLPLGNFMGRGKQHSCGVDAYIGQKTSSVHNDQ